MYTFNAMDLMQASAQSAPAPPQAPAAPQTPVTAPARALTAQQTRDQLRNDIQALVRASVQDGMRNINSADQRILQEKILRELTVARPAQDARGDRAPFPITPPRDIPPISWYNQSQPPDLRNAIPREAVGIAGILGMTLVFCVVGFPIARALARWIDRRGTPQPVNREVSLRLEAIETAVESIAVEVERISEGQRFTSRVLSERVPEPVHTFSIPDRDAIPLSSQPANSRRG